jgi:hypothetical protein
MKKSYFTIVLTLTCLFGCGISAHAQDPSAVTAKIPFEFVVGVKTLPAGTYTISRVSPVRSGLIIHSYEEGTIVLPVAIDDPSPQQAELSFEHVGDKYFLSKIETPAAVFTIAIPRGMTRLGLVKIDGAVSSSGN